MGSRKTAYSSGRRVSKSRFTKSINNKFDTEKKWISQRKEKAF